MMKLIYKAIKRVRKKSKGTMITIYLEVHKAFAEEQKNNILPLLKIMKLVSNN